MVTVGDFVGYDACDVLNSCSFYLPDGDTEYFVTGELYL